jgi:hypothetical protein
VEYSVNGMECYSIPICASRYRSAFRVRPGSLALVSIGPFQCFSNDRLLVVVERHSLRQEMISIRRGRARTLSGVDADSRRG